MKLLEAPTLVLSRSAVLQVGDPVVHGVVGQCVLRQVCRGIFLEWMWPSSTWHQATDGSGRKVGIRRNRVVLIARRSNVSWHSGLIGVAVGKEQVVVLRARKNDR